MTPKGVRAPSSHRVAWPTSTPRPIEACLATAASSEPGARMNGPPFEPGNALHEQFHKAAQRQRRTAGRTQVLSSVCALPTPEPSMIRTHGASCLLLPGGAAAFSAASLEAQCPRLLLLSARRRDDSFTRSSWLERSSLRKPLCGEAASPCLGVGTAVLSPSKLVQQEVDRTIYSTPNTGEPVSVLPSCFRWRPRAKVLR